MAKPIDKDYLLDQLKLFDEKILKDKFDEKIDIQQSADNKGKALVIGADGKVAPTKIDSYDDTAITERVAALENAGYITADAIKDKADKSTTLAGYGITDAATSTQGGKADSAVQSVKIGTTEYKSGTTVTLPAYPTTLPASNTTSTYSATGTAPVNGKAVASAISGKADSSAIPTESTVSGWGFTKNAGTVTSVKVGDTSYSQTGGVVSLPAYPTTLPANGGTAANVSGTVAVANGGTGATNAASARTNLGLGDAAVKTVTSTVSDTANLPTASAVKSYVDAAVAGASNYLGTVTALTGLSTAAKKGDFYRVSTAWTGVHVGDIIIAEKSSPTQTIDGTNWSLLHNEINTDTTYSLTQDTSNGHKITLTPSSGTAQTITIPDNNTTYTFAEGSTNGAFSVTPSGGSATSVKVHGVLTSHQDISGKENSSNKVTAWSSTTTDAHYPSEKLVKTTLDGKQASLTTAQLNAVNSGITSTKVSTYDGYATTIASKGTYSKPSGGIPASDLASGVIPTSLPANGGTATNVSGTVAVANGGTGATTAANARTNLGLGGAATKSVDTSITAASTSANLPTSAAVASFVEGKGYKTTDNDTKNTAGSTDTSSKIFLIGATSQAANPQTYSHDTAYVGTDGCLYSDGKKVLTSHQSLSGYVPNTRTVNGKALSSNVTLSASDIKVSSGKTVEEAIGSGGGGDGITDVTQAQYNALTDAQKKAGNYFITDAQNGKTVGELSVEVSNLNESLNTISTYVGEDGKLHFVDASGADTVLPFSSGSEMHIMSNYLNSNYVDNPITLFAHSIYARYFCTYDNNKLTITRKETNSNTHLIYVKFKNNENINIFSHQYGGHIWFNGEEITNISSYSTNVIANVEYEIRMYADYGGQNADAQIIIQIK